MFAEAVYVRPNKNRLIRLSWLRGTYECEQLGANVINPMRILHEAGTYVFAGKTDMIFYM